MKFEEAIKELRNGNKIKRIAFNDYISSEDEITLTIDDINATDWQVSRGLKEITLGAYCGIPVKWIVLEENENEMFLLSKYIFEMRRFDKETNNFDKSEIKEFLSEYMKHRFFGINIEEITLLSKDEIKCYLPEPKDRIAYLEPTKYGANTKAVYWLRSPNCYDNNYANCVYYDGDISSNYVNDTNGGVRAAVKIKKRGIKYEN